VFGIEIDLHYSWFFIAALLTTSLAGHLYTINRDWPAILVWSLAGATAIAFFAAILAHELSHAAVARLRGVPVPSIMLFALGGMARMSRDAADPRTEFWMGLAGPAASILIGGAALALARLLGWNFTATPDTPGLVMLVWFGYINLTLAVFNMIPGFPLDGGRVLRAAVWWLTGNQARATRIAAGLGQIVAAAFMVFGLFSVVAGGGVGGLWLAFIGWFLSDAARAARAEIEVTERLRGVRVGDVMARDCATVPRTARIDEIADEVLRTGRRCFVVVDDGRVAGLLTPQEMRQVERTHWHSTLAGDVMKPIERLHHVTAGAPVTEALEMLAREDVNQLLVLEEDRLRGIISRDQILRLLSARAELSM
jgi:Zn-dependent protease/predicted transcriptional regulator